ncbi:unnamed protein product [Dicrocoelium dendriticum]|nr:unnamed protein product [Dicrocoelium dendriticum]
MQPIGALHLNACSIISYRLVFVNCSLMSGYAHACLAGFRGYHSSSATSSTSRDSPVKSHHEPLLKVSHMHFLSTTGSSNSSSSKHSGRSTVDVVPSSSPDRLRCTSSFNQYPQHRCIDPINCTQTSRRQYRLLRSTYVLSCLPPFIHSEQVSDRELLTRRLDTYFYRYPHQEYGSNANAFSDSRLIRPSELGSEVTVSENSTKAKTAFRCSKTNSSYSSGVLMETISSRRLSSTSLPSLLHADSSVTVESCAEPLRPFCSVMDLPHSHHMPCRTPCTFTVNTYLLPSATTGMVTNLPLDAISASCQTSLFEEIDELSVLPVQPVGPFLHPPTYSDLVASRDSTHSLTGLTCTSSRSINCSPDRVSPTNAPESPYIYLDESLHTDLLRAPGGSASSVTESLEHAFPLCDSIPPKRNQLFTSLLTSHSPATPTLTLPYPPSADSFSTVHSHEAPDWPPAPSDVSSDHAIADVTAHSHIKDNNQFRVCRNVVNVLITPCASWFSSSPTQVSPPTEVLLEYSPLVIKDEEMLSSVYRSKPTIGSSANDNNLYPRNVVSSASHSHQTFDTPESVDTSSVHLRTSSTKAIHLRGVLNSGDGPDCCPLVETDPTNHPVILNTPTVDSTRLSPGLLPPQRRKVICSPIFAQRSSGSLRNRSRTPRQPAPTSSEVYASIQSKFLITSSPQLHKIHSGSLDCVSSRRSPPQSTILSRLGHSGDGEPPTVSHLFSVPDIIGLRNSVSNVGSPQPPTQHKGLCGTQGRPTDRRLYRILQRYPGSRADMLSETQHVHGTDLAFVVLSTTSWHHMLCLVRDVDRCFPHWHLARQLHRRTA